MFWLTEIDEKLEIESACRKDRSIENGFRVGLLVRVSGDCCQQVYLSEGRGRGGKGFYKIGDGSMGSESVRFIVEVDNSVEGIYFKVTEKCVTCWNTFEQRSKAIHSRSDHPLPNNTITFTSTISRSET